MSEEKYEVNVRPEKVTVVEEMKEKLGYQGVVLVTFNKLDVKNATLLRRKFLAHGVEYKVIKNTLTRIAANDLGITGLDDLLQGTNGLAVCKDDPVAPAAALKEFLAETKSEAVVVSWPSRWQSHRCKGVQALADLPSREQLLGMVAATPRLLSQDWHVHSTQISRNSHMLSKQCVNRKNLRKIYA